MNLLQKKILNRLLDKKESKRNLGDSDKSTRRTVLHVNRKEYPDYFSISSGEFKQQFHEAIEELEQQGWLIIEWEKYSKGEEVKKLLLRDVDTGLLYAALNRQPKEDKLNTALDLIRRYQKTAPSCLSRLYEIICEKLHKGYSVAAILPMEDLTETEDILKGLHALVENQEEVVKRKWSIALYQDSKRWESLEKKILSLVKRYVFPKYESLEDRDLLLEFSIIQNPEMVYIYGNMTVQKGDYLLQFLMQDEGTGVHLSLFKQGKIASLDVEKVVTIENKTSFYDYVARVKENGEKTLVLYLGGFHTSHRRQIIKQIQRYILEQCIPVSFYHWGDIDLGGMLIWKHLCDKTGIPFLPLYMDKETYHQYKSYGKRVSSEEYMKRLRRLLEDIDFSPYHSTIIEILKNKITIEQESIVL